MTRFFQQRRFGVFVLAGLVAATIGIVIFRRRLLTTYDEFEVGQDILSQAANSIAVPMMLIILSIVFALDLSIRRAEKSSRLQLTIAVAAICLVAFFVFGNTLQLVRLLRAL